MGVYDVITKQQKSKMEYKQVEIFDKMFGSALTAWSSTFVYYIIFTLYACN